MTRRGNQFAGAIVVIGSVAAIFVALDYTVGNWQARELLRRAALKARLDKLSFEGVRTGIDDITFIDGRYVLRLLVQNAAREPLHILRPTLEGFVQIGHTWEPFQIRLAEAEGREGMILRLVTERAMNQHATIATQGYAEPLAGYRHVKITLESFVSPEENPQEEIGERHEEFFLFLRDVTRDQEFPDPTSRPHFIPLRAWTLLPKEAL